MATMMITATTTAATVRLALGVAAADVVGVEVGVMVDGDRDAKYGPLTPHCGFQKNPVTPDVNV